MRTHSIFAVLSIGCGYGGVIQPCIDKAKCQQPVETCTGSVKIFDSTENLIGIISHTDSPGKRLGLQSSGGKAQMEGNCCFEARQRAVGKGGKSKMVMDNMEYSLEFKVNYVIQTDCLLVASTSWIPQLITAAVVAVLAIIALIVYINKRNSGFTPVNTQS